MMILAQVCLLTTLSASPSPVDVQPNATCSLAVAPQGENRKPAPGPSGGTPEPMTLLLLAGGALTYGALRLRRRKPAEPKES